MKKRRLYLGRSKFCGYELAYAINPKTFNPERGFDKYVYIFFCTREFERHTGIKLKIGEVREVESLITIKKK